MLASSNTTTIKRMIQIRLWLVPAALLILSAAFASLGRWQLERAEVNRRIEQSYQQSDNLPALDLALEDISVEDQRYRRIRLTGHYDPTVQVLLDNITRDSQAGYEVLTPFLVEETGVTGAADRWVLVNRGWVPAAWDRSVLPDVSIMPESATVEGKIASLPRAGLTLGPPAMASDSPVVVLSFPGYQELESVLERNVYAFQLLLNENAPSGFVRRWGPVANRVERNIAYAVQWFGLAVLVFSIGIGIGVNRYRRSSVIG